MSDLLISYQLHSRNDLREWNAIFRKDATSLKIDPHFLRYSDQFVLSHDTPFPWQPRHNQYSTLDDVLLYLQSAPTFLHGKSIVFALCFKAAPVSLCHAGHQDDQDVRQWMHMAESFFARADQVVKDVQQNFGITVTFVLDGDGKPCDCLADKFLPWKSTWIDTDQCSQDCYNSDEGYCERFAILNDPSSSDWASMSTKNNHYGKFGLSKNQTLQVWEPDTQENISALVDLYMEGRDEGVPSGGGLGFAINIDIAMFDTFTARSLSRTDQARGFNLVVDDDDTHFARTPSPVYETAGEMTLRYYVPGDESSQQQRRQRKLFFSPFTQIDVGPPRVDKEASVSLRSRFGLVSPLRSVDSDKDDAHIRSKFGQSTVASWSNQQVGDYNFLFVAIEGKVYATAKRDETDDTDFRLIGLGTSVHASSLGDTLLLVTEGNNCYNSHIHNTRSTPLVCRPQINPLRHSCKYAIDYSVGTAENWFRWLQRTRAVITPCNDYILHGTFSAGHNPSGALFPLDAKSQAEGKVGIMVANEPYPLPGESKCGTPFRGESGIVISSFASPVVTDLYAQTFQYVERTALESDQEWTDFLQLSIGFVIGIFVCWLLRWWKRRSTENYESI